MSEQPQRIGEILPSVMQNIEKRMESNKTETVSRVNAGHRARVLGAVGAFMRHKNPCRRFRCASSKYGL